MIAFPVSFQRHTYEDSTFKAESSTGNTRLADRFLTKLSVFCGNFALEDKVGLAKSSKPLNHSVGVCGAGEMLRVFARHSTEPLID